MEQKTILHDRYYRLPAGFFRQIIEDITPESWIRWFENNPSLKEPVFEAVSIEGPGLPHLLLEPNVLAHAFKTFSAAFRSAKENL